MPFKYIPIAERFWTKVNKTDTCWLWTAGKSSDGYGCISDRHSLKLRAHRVAYEMAYGPIPEDQVVCHRCDVPLCVRPDHLFLGTRADNIYDKVAKGRQKRGEAMTHTILTDEDVRHIRAEYVPRKVSTYTLSRKYGVSQATISQVILYKSWRHIE